MPKSYGNIPRGGKKTAPAPSPEITVTIHGTFTLEGLSRELHLVVARLNDRNAHGVRNCRLIMEPVDHKGEAITLWSDDGKPLSRFSLNAPPAAPTFSDKI